MFQSHCGESRREGGNKPQLKNVQAHPTHTTIFLIKKRAHDER